MNEQKTHSYISASNSFIWLQCGGYGLLSKQDPKKENQKNIAMGIGTDVHEVCEKILNGKDYEKLIKEIIKEEDRKLVTNNVLLYKKYVDFYREEAIMSLVEERVILVEGKEGREEIAGIVDFACIKNNTLHIIDYKNGVVPISAYRNIQLTMYACAFLNTHKEYLEKIENVTLHIVQPNSFSADTNGFANDFTYTIDELKIEMEKFLEQVEKIENGSTEFNIGAWCKSCKFKGECMALNDKMNEVVTIGNNVPDIKMMTKEQKEKVVLYKDLVTSWIKAVEQSVYSEMINGEKYNQLKLIKTSGRRGWDTSKKDLLVEKLKEKEINPFKEVDPPIINMTEAEKLVNKGSRTPKGEPKPFDKEFGEFIKMSEGNVKLVPSIDKGIEYIPEEHIGSEFAGANFDEEDNIF